MIVDLDKALKIIEKHGENHQRYKAAEELSELQTLVLQDANGIGMCDKTQGCCEWYWCPKRKGGDDDVD